MFGSMQRMLGIVQVKEIGNMIHVSGVPTDTMQRAIKKLWSTQRINTWMFSETKRSSFSFHRFFAADIHYMLLQLMNENAVSWGTRNTIQKIIEGLHTETWYRQTRTDLRRSMNLSKLSGLNVNLFDYQLGYLKNYEQNTVRYGLLGNILSAAPGSGKTINTLALMEVLEAKLKICVCPKNAVEDVWVKTIESVFKTKRTFWKSTSETPYRGEEFIVTHYESLGRVLAELKTFYGRTSIPVTAITLDESHNLNEIDRVRTDHFISLCRLTKSPDIVWASGTPFKAMGYECIPILRTIDPLFDSDAEARFKQIFGRNSKRGVDIIANRIGRMSYTVEKKQIQTLKPIQVNHKIQMAKSSLYTLDAVRDKMRAYIEQRRSYYAESFHKYKETYERCLEIFRRTLQTPIEFKDFEEYRDCIRVISNGYDAREHKEIALFANRYEKQKIIPALPGSEKEKFRSAKSVIKYVELKIMGEALGGVLGRMRTQCHVDMVPHLPMTKIVTEGLKKTVIFTSYVEVVKAIEDRCKIENFKPICVYGETTKDLPALVKRFFEDPEANPLIATYQSLSTAVPLIAANQLILVNQPFRDYILKQATARVDRVGQDTQTYFHSTFLDTGELPNISTRSNDILEWSREQVALLMGVDNPGEELEAMNRLVSSLESMSGEVPELEESSLEDFREFVLEAIEKSIKSYSGYVPENFDELALCNYE